MRTIEEIKKELQGITGIKESPGPFPFLAHEARMEKLFDELIAAHDAEIARLRQQLEWQPIETAPKDGTVIELITPLELYPFIGAWHEFDFMIIRGLRLPGRCGWYDQDRTLREIKNPTLWRAIPPRPQAQEGSYE